MSEKVGYAANLFGRCRAELGFVLQRSLETAEQRGELYVVDGGAAYVWRRRDLQTTLHAIAVEPDRRGQRIGITLLIRIMTDARGWQQNRILARCPVGLAANGWYPAVNFVLLGTEPGKGRDLNVWQLPL